MDFKVINISADDGGARITYSDQTYDTFERCADGDNWHLQLHTDESGAVSTISAPDMLGRLTFALQQLSAPKSSDSDAVAGTVSH